MDVLGSLRKLLGAPFIQEQVQQPTSDVRFDNGRQAKRTQQPYAGSSMEIGTADKPYVRLNPPRQPSSLNSLIDGNERRPLYRIYGDESGNRTLENDNAPSGDPRAVMPYRPPAILPDQPSNPQVSPTIGNTLLQRRRPTTRNIQSMRI